MIPESITLPRRHRRLRWLVIACGVAIFLWLSPEDNHVLPVVMLALVATLTAILLWTLDRFGGVAMPTRGFLALLLALGALSGIGTSVLTAFLMMLKNVRHSHVSLDFPPGLILAILERAPLWILAGALIGLSLALAMLALLRR